MDKLLSITEVAEEFGVTARTIRFYESKGLISPQRVGSTRAYSYKDRGRLKLIFRAKRLGFSLTDINEYLELYIVDQTQKEQVHLLLDKVNGRISELEQQQEDLIDTLEELREIQKQCSESIDTA
ncbi:MAG: MerR family transcriptional regulator [endosymbiont of Galathealinum brachiosum]|uniref:MerR family transcriptional regulator n=1 Tax=endosymbiont of Galathealinum brachiosum TaxID=2200906 RepID=A0A370D9C4_9GAMM|nr:MAG: MerR family transcriptional regulator [endosymbiont of Galathealinum brachiosum]